jgi:hypothetical protein
MRLVKGVDMKAFKGRKSGYLIEVQKEDLPIFLEFGRIFFALRWAEKNYEELQKEFSFLPKEIREGSETKNTLLKIALERVKDIDDESILDSVSLIADNLFIAGGIEELVGKRITTLKYLKKISEELSQKLKDNPTLQVLNKIIKEVEDA